MYIVKYPLRKNVKEIRFINNRFCNNLCDTDILP